MCRPWYALQPLLYLHTQRLPRHSNHPVCDATVARLADRQRVRLVYVNIHNRSYQDRYSSALGVIPIWLLPSHSLTDR